MEPSTCLQERNGCTSLQNVVGYTRPVQSVWCPCMVRESASLLPTSTTCKGTGSLQHPTSARSLRAKLRAPAARGNQELAGTRTMSGQEGEQAQPPPGHCSGRTRTCSHPARQIAPSSHTYHNNYNTTGSCFMPAEEVTALALPHLSSTPATAP